jgi:hypothetical protein
MTTTAWAHLPNAKHIDRILADLGQRPERWVAAPGARDAAWDATRDAAWDTGRDDAWGVAWDAAWDAAWGDTQDAAREDAAWGATAALIAWDDCARLLDQPVDAVRLLAACGHHPAILLLPACIAFAKD